MGKNKRVGGQSIYDRLANDPSTYLTLLVLRLAFSLVDLAINVYLYYDGSFSDYKRTLKHLMTRSDNEMFWNLFFVNYIILGFAIVFVYYWKTSDIRRIAGLFTLIHGGFDLYFSWYTWDQLETIDYVAIAIDIFLIFVGSIIFFGKDSKTRRHSQSKRKVSINRKTTGQKESDAFIELVGRAQEAIIEKQWDRALGLWQNIEEIATKKKWGGKVAEAQQNQQYCMEKKGIRTSNNPDLDDLLK